MKQSETEAALGNAVAAVHQIIQMRSKGDRSWIDGLDDDGFEEAVTELEAALELWREETR